MKKRKIVSLALAAIMALSVFTTSGGISFADDEVVESEIIATDMDAQEMPEDEGSVTEPDAEAEPTAFEEVIDEIAEETVTAISTNIELIPEDIPINYSANVPSGIGGNPVGTTTIYTGSSVSYGSNYSTNYMSTSGTPSASNNNAYCVDPSLGTPYNNSTCTMYEVTDRDLRTIMYYSVGAPGEADGLNTSRNCISEYDDKTDNIICTHIALSKTMYDKGYTTNDDWKTGMSSIWQNATSIYTDVIKSLATPPSNFHVYYLVDGNSSRQGIMTWRVLNTGSLEIIKTVNNAPAGTTPIDLTGIKFHIHKSTNSSNQATNIDTSTEVATFTCDSLGNTTVTYVNPTYASSGSLNTGTLTGLATGDYVIFEDTGVWNTANPGRDFERVTVVGNDDQTVKTSFALTSTRNGNYEASKNMGYGTGYAYTYTYGSYGAHPQYYCTFTIENVAELKKEVIANNWVKSLNLKKSSANTSITNNNSCYDLTGATYAVYEGRDSADNATEDNYTTLPGYIGELVVQKVVDSNGNVEYVSNTIPGLESQPYFVKEVKAPKGYALDPNTHRCDLSDSTQLVDNTYTLRVTDPPQYDPVGVLLKKTNSSGEPIRDAQYTIKFYPGENTNAVDPGASGTNPDRVWVVKTDENGEAKTDNNHKVSGPDWYTNPNTGAIEFPLGTVTIQETLAPANYVLDNTVHVRVITGEHNGSQAINTYNVLEHTESKSCNIKLTKSSANTGISAGNANYSLKDAVYAVYDRADSVNRATASGYANLDGYVGSLVTDDNGESNTLTGLEEDKTYYVKEVVSPKGFALNTTVYTVTLDNAHIDTTNTYLITSNEQPKSVSADLLVVKKDSENNEPVADAEYTVKFYAGQYANGVDPAILGATATNTWVVKTDANGKAAVTDKITGGDWYRNSTGDTVFPFGTVTIVETKAPTEYKLNPTVYVRTLTEDNPNTSVETSNTLVSVDTNDVPRTQPFELVKLQETTDNLTVPLQGAGFSACNVADLARDNNGNYIWDDSKRVALARDGSLEMFTDVNGNAKSADLRYGTYLVRETTVPRNLLPIADFYVVIDDDSTPQQLRYFIDKRFKAYLKIVKEDADTQRPIISDDATFKIWSYDNNRYVKFNAVVGGAIQAVDTFTTSAGVIMTPDALPAGRYRVEEIDAPYAYVGGASVDIDITNTGMFQIYIDENGRTTDMGVYTVTMYNTPYEGRLELTKIGEEYAPDNSGEWVKKDIPLKDVKFDVVAVDDIPTTDGQDILYNAGDVVETITTDSNGFAKTSVNLPEGSYVVKEKVTPEGYYKAKDVKFDISFAENVNANYEAVAEVEVINYKKVELGTTAKDSETNDNISKADEQVVIVDTVSYKNLIVGHSYTVKGVLMNKKTGEEFKDAKGNTVKAEKTFVADKGVGTIDITFPAFDGSLLKNQSVVVFETMYEDGIEIASHTEISDEGQTIDFPSVHTTATAEDGSKSFVFTEADTIKLIDTVTYTNVLPGKKYNLSGVLMDKATNKPVTNLSGMPIIATAEFTATDKNGTAEVVFTVENASKILGGKTVVVFEDMTYNGVSIATHADITDVDQTVDFPGAHTSLSEATSGLKTVVQTKEVTLNDIVTYTNLIVGKKYVLKGKLMDKETGLPFVDADGKEVFAEKAFIPTATSGTETVTFTFNAKLNKSYSVVAFEDVYEEESGRLVCFHCDIDDNEQTVEFPEFSLGTTANWSNGKKEIKPGKDTKIIDRCQYKLPVGYTYEISGIIMDKATGKELLIDGKTITAKATFTPTTDSGDICTGEVNVTYGPFDTTNFTNNELVVFEEVRAIAYADGTPIENPEVVVEHKVLSDEGQTVKVTRYPKTGDYTPIIPAVIVMLVCAGFGVFIIFLKKKRY